MYIDCSVRVSGRAGARLARLLVRESERVLSPLIHFELPSLQTLKIFMEFRANSFRFI